MPRCSFKVFKIFVSFVSIGQDLNINHDRTELRLSNCKVLFVTSKNVRKKKLITRLDDWVEGACNILANKPQIADQSIFFWLILSIVCEHQLSKNWHKLSSWCKNPFYVFMELRKWTQTSTENVSVLLCLLVKFSNLRVGASCEGQKMKYLYYQTGTC
jgi:hypothetical protein